MSSKICTFKTLESFGDGRSSRVGIESESAKGLADGDKIVTQNNYSSIFDNNASTDDNFSVLALDPRFSLCSTRPQKSIVDGQIIIRHAFLAANMLEVASAFLLTGSRYPILVSGVYFLLLLSP